MSFSSLTPEQKENIHLVTGSAHPELGRKIAHSMGMQLSEMDLKSFSNGELYARFVDSVRGKDVFIVQTHQNGEVELNGRPKTFSVNDAIMEHFLMINAAKSSSPNSVTAVTPLIGYSRADRKSRGRESVSVVTSMAGLINNGADRIVTVDLHSAQTQLIATVFKKQFDHLTAQALLADAVRDEIKDYDPDDCIIVAPDAGSGKLAEQQQDELDLDLMYLAKKRKRGQSEIITRESRVKGVKNKVCVIFDDMVDTAGTMVSAVDAIKNSGAEVVIVATTHAVFSGSALKKIGQSGIDKIIVTDTVPTTRAEKKLKDQIRIVSVAPIIGQALVEIASGGSVSRLFKDLNHR